MIATTSRAWPRLLVFAAAWAAALLAPAAAQECGPTAVGYRVMHLAGRVVAAWYPTAATPIEHNYGPRFSSTVAADAPPSLPCGSKVPLVVFSHGDLGCGLQSVALTEELARHGYVVAAPDHADAALCHSASPAVAASRAPQANVFKPETWTSATFIDRRDDVEAVIDALLSSGDLGAVIDAERIGAAGHSLGGYTAVGLAGGWPDWTDPRIRAVLALSPYVMPFQVHKTLGQVRVPLMYQGGTLDVGITPFLKGANGAYSQANPPVFLVELRNAGHFAWVNCGRARTTAACLETRPTFRLIDAYGIAFFDRYLKHAAAPLLARQNPDLADYAYRLPNE